MTFLEDNITMDVEEFEEKHPRLVDNFHTIDNFIADNSLDEDDTYYIEKHIREGNIERALSILKYIKNDVYRLYWAVENAYDYVKELTEEKKNG